MLPGDVATGSLTSTTHTSGPFPCANTCHQAFLSNMISKDGKSTLSVLFCSENRPVHSADLFLVAGAAVV